MHLSQISFCDGVGYNIKDDSDKETITDELKEFSVSVLSRQFERLGSDATLKAIHSNPHLLSARTHGNSYFLYLTTVNGVEQCIFIDKKIQQGYFQPRMIMSKLWFDRSLFSGTVFEGEMVRSAKQSWTFIVNDLIVDSGVHLANVNLVRRVNRIYDILSRSFTRDDMDLCKLEVKRYFTYEKIEELTSWSQSLPYDTRGIVFKSLYLKFKDILLDYRDEADIKKGRERMKSRTTKVTTGFSLKGKSKIDEGDVDHSDDCVQIEAKEVKTEVKTIKKTNLPDVYEIVGQEDRKEVVCIPNIMLSKDMRAAFARVGVADTVKMRCSFHDKFNKWVPDPIAVC